ncbi:3-methyl-2-oxobutanoate hydroxymethyltransferase [Aquibacillus salsiterrae]|uniref:3-methyl-2-oxobutanoate hydroxymethyltransferase n=1 Tax=Aquibacillus salsiterrae TaxID=2950439 RepID=A0A9X3WBG0_9BACI|nr:3-methyl-2-oxobutanoate hydroxymethyltransferase [Aquibacillus salsiterrae]MDC3415353.1 3-methyl-2-oxobutanoate hydroxymethyltransferase [Aquibacillus salsiterrae]
MKSRFSFEEMKKNQDKITMVTAYDYPSAKLAERAEVDMILVGDSLGMVVLGYPSTIHVTVDDMLHHAKAARRGAPNTYTVVDMPFMSYHVSLEDSMKNAKTLFQQTGAQALKIEGASAEVVQLTSRLTSAGIPVVAHIGLTPQSVNVLGGYRVQGKEKDTAKRLIEEAVELEKHGAIAIVLECVPKEVARLITNKLSIPTIGIGAGIDCDGQVLVYHDIIQYGVNRVPKFVKPYGDVNHSIKQSISSYIAEVKAQTFPNDSYSFTIDEHELPEGKLED